ncbi:hypothetical protein, partial [Liquorilactobacillus satsumensis]|uniref:hypothetical protein n=1 Tax=Liquorilactobacillus satsumensis TaxID=259059 RepID=UPI0039EC2439
ISAIEYDVSENRPKAIFSESWSYAYKLFPNAFTKEDEKHKNELLGIASDFWLLSNKISEYRKDNKEMVIPGYVYLEGLIRRGVQKIGIQYPQTNSSGRRIFNLSMFNGSTGRLNNSNNNGKPEQIIYLEKLYSIFHTYRNAFAHSDELNTIPRPIVDNERAKELLQNACELFDEYYNLF